MKRLIKARGEAEDELDRELKLQEVNFFHFNKILLIFQNREKDWMNIWNSKKM